MSFTKQPGVVADNEDVLAGLAAAFNDPTDLTDEDETAANSGDEATDDVIENIRTRVGEIAAALIAAGLITDDADA